MVLGHLRVSWGWSCLRNPLLRQLVHRRCRIRVPLKGFSIDASRRCRRGESPKGLLEKRRKWQRTGRGISLH